MQGMKSLVLELQQESMNPETKVSDLLRKALVVATKLNVKEFREWIDQELHGYKGDAASIPKYRHIKCELKATRPMYGLVPAIIGNAELEEKLSILPNNQPISELEHFACEKESGSTLQAPLPGDIARELNSKSFALGIIPTRVIGQARIHGIIESVRNIVLEWSLKLEADGILGEGLTFSKEEKATAASATYHIQNFTGIVGTVHSSVLQIGDYNSIHAELKRLGIPQADRSELGRLMDRVKDAKGEEKTNFIKQGLEWVLAHGPQLGALAEMIKRWFESQ